MLERAQAETEDMWWPQAYSTALIASSRGKVAGEEATGVETMGVDGLVVTVVVVVTVAVGRAEILKVAVRHDKEKKAEQVSYTALVDVFKCW